MYINNPVRMYTKSFPSLHIPYTLQDNAQKETVTHFAVLLHMFVYVKWHHKMNEQKKEKKIEEKEFKCHLYSNFI